MVAAEVYQCHYDELPAERQDYVLELIAMKITINKEQERLRAENA